MKNRTSATEISTELIPNYMEQSIETLSNEISLILNDAPDSIWLYGSVVFDDFRLGWSDIDFLAFSKEVLSEKQADELMFLRQTLSEKYPDNPYYRLFEGIIVSRNEFLRGKCERAVYWGTSGQRITKNCTIDTFSRFELAKYGKSVAGKGDRSIFVLPTNEELRSAVKSHLDGIRTYAKTTDESLYSCGWLLDISRCIYTLRFCDVISKTRAGVWALNENIFTDKEPLIKTLEIRKTPLQYKDSPHIRKWLSGLGDTVQRYADVLETELMK